MVVRHRIRPVKFNDYRIKKEHHTLKKQDAEDEQSEERSGKVENKGLSTHFDPDALYRGLQWRLRDEYFGTPKVDFFYGPSKD